MAATQADHFGKTEVKKKFFSFFFCREYLKFVGKSGCLNGVCRGHLIIIIIYWSWYQVKIAWDWGKRAEKETVFELF